MAEELDLGAKLQEDAINNVSQSVGTGFDGLTPSVESIDANVKSIKDEFSSGWFFETLNSILDNNKSQSEKQEKRDIQNENTSAAIDHICEVADLDRNDNVDNNAKKTKTSGLKVDDLKDLNATSGLGFALISTQIADIANTLNKSKSLISHGLATLRENGLVKTRREGKIVYYSIDDEEIAILLKSEGLILEDIDSWEILNKH